MTANYQDKYIEEKFAHLNEKIEIINHNQEKFLRKILEQTKKTNGRVNKLEQETIPKIQKETAVMRFLTKNPRVALLGFLLISSIYISDVRHFFWEYLQHFVK